MLTNMRTCCHGDSQKQPVNTRCHFGALFLKSNIDNRSFFKQKEKPNENISEAANNTDRNPPAAAAASDGLAAAGRRYAGTCRAGAEPGGKLIFWPPLRPPPPPLYRQLLCGTIFGRRCSHMDAFQQRTSN